MKRALLGLAACLLGCGEGHAGLHTGGDMALPPTEQVIFGAIGDYGLDGMHEADVASMVRRWQPDLIITLGDNNYQNGDRATIDMNIGKYYSDYIGGYMGHFGMGSPINLFFPSVGNHDWYDAEALQPYLDYFPDLPGNKRYYDFQLGLVHFYVVDSDQHEPDGYTPDSVQGKWLQEALAAPTDACYKVVYFHHPPYSSGDFASPWMRWPFAAWGADAVLAGHDHLYERLAVDGIPYFVNGAGGDDDLFGFPNNNVDPHSQFRFVDPRTFLCPDWGAQRVIATRTAMTFEFWAVSGGMVDGFSVTPKLPCR